MTVNSAATSNEQFIYATLEVSKNSWLLTIQDPCRDNLTKCLSLPLEGHTGGRGG